MLKCLVLISGTILIGKIEEVAAELGDPLSIKLVITTKSLPMD